MGRGCDRGNKAIGGAMKGEGGNDEMKDSLKDAMKEEM